MKELITELTDALTQCKDEEPLNIALVTALHPSSFIWKLNYPIALVNAKSRMQANSDIEQFQAEALFDRDDKTPLQPSHDQLEAIATINPAYLQSVSLMCLKSEPKQRPYFQTKRQNDYWKKIQDVSHIKAIIEMTHVQNDGGVCDLEFSLREIIRKRKEVHALKEVGFVWIAPTSKDVSPLFKHYFNDNYTFIQTQNKRFYLGWSPSIREISMRYFLCPPALKQD